MPPEMKVAYEMIWAMADNSGVWSVNTALAESVVGKKVNWELFLTATKGRVMALSEDEWMLTGFIEMQCGKLSEECRPHKVVIDLLRKRGLLSDSLSIVYPETSLLVHNTIPIQVKGPVSGPREGMQGEGKEPTQSDVFVSVWNALPSPPFAHIRQMSPARCEALRARMKEEFWAANWRGGIAMLPTQKYASGQGDGGWVLDVDFFLKPNSLTKIIEGKYANAGNGKTADALHSQIDPERGW